MPHLVAPSILAAEFLKLYDEIDIVNRSEADWLHIDIMDGHFVPNISFGLTLMPAFKTASQKPLDVHLMIEKPDDYIERFAKAGADVLTVHLEACNHLHRTIEKIKALDVRAGVAVNPHTPVNLLEDIIEDVDLVCLMSVNPGYGGQKFIPNTLSKIRKLKLMIEEKNLNTLIEIDGGVIFDNASSILKAGANVLVAGSTVFKSANPIDSIKILKGLD